jgi:hypothetical protein
LPFTMCCSDDAFSFIRICCLIPLALCACGMRFIIVYGAKECDEGSGTKCEREQKRENFKTEARSEPTHGDVSTIVHLKIEFTHSHVRNLNLHDMIYYIHRKLAPNKSRGMKKFSKPIYPPSILVLRNKIFLLPCVCLCDKSIYENVKPYIYTSRASKSKRDRDNGNVATEEWKR